MNNESKQKTYILENLGCANCAAKMERKIQDLPEIGSASITFATKQLRIEAVDPESLVDEIQSICRSIEGEVMVVEKCAVKAHVSYPSDPSSKAKNGFFSGHKADIVTLVVGAVLFAAGVVLEHVWGYDMWFAGGGRIVLLALTIFIAAYLILGHKVLLTALRNISHGQVFDENFLMSIATISAFCIGEYAEAAGVMLFYRIGQLFEDIAVERSRSQIMEAVDMRPETVTLVAADEHYHDDHHHDSIHIIPAGDAKPGDILLVRPGDRIPLDGIVIEGESRIDTSPVTGEPVPVSAHPGTEVISGCINEQGVLKIRVTKPLSESMVTRILDSVENAAAGKPKIDKFITKFAHIYTPIVVALAVLTAVVPSLITGDWAVWIKTAITFLVISCPCALVISVPLAFFSGIGAASKLGILFKGGLAIEALKNIKSVVMDKTGTITKGVFEVDSISAFGDFNEEDIIEIAAACEASSSHPIAASILEKYRNLQEHEHHHDHHHYHCDCGHGHAQQHFNALSIEEIAGMGVRAQLAGGTALCGNRNLMTSYGIELPELDETSGTEVLIALDKELIGRITISDQLKNDSISAINRLKGMGLIPAMLTGDNLKSAENIASSTGISEIHAGLLPDEKLTALKSLRVKHGSVMFVGDGINDAPVLAGADVGAAMGSGADAAIEAADVVFMTSSLTAVPQSIQIARYTRRIALQNIVFALAIKLLVILLGFIGFANIWAAVFADTGVAMLCILNSLRILWRKYS
ncbi:MAG: heavy metal translocating P-type ATPase [Firmicutes bacterium]|nr:heavy metal translocating P-type ATPase [Bacillota bacterium]MBR6798669.1 heavy metal translocating P-type ATPase [Bacillota bacterium]